MILARRVTGHLIRFYPLPSLPPRSTIAWAFEPSPFCNLVRQELSGPGFCAVAKTVAEARAALIQMELLQ